MSRPDKIGKTATEVYADNGFMVIKYYNTEVVKFNAEVIILNTGGWRTMTTKTRMNQASRQFGLGFLVRQYRHVWTVTHKGHVIGFPEQELSLSR